MSPGFEVVAIVGDLLDGPLRHAGGRATARSASRGACRSGPIGGAVGPAYLQRQVERERAALARRAAQLDLAAEQVGKLAADRQAQAGAAVLAAGAGVGLLEGLEDDLLLLGRDADAGVRDLEGDDRRRLAEDRMIGAPAAVAPRTMRSRTPPCSVNLKALESRFFNTCCRRLESVTMLRSRWGSSSTSKESWRRSASWRNGRATVSTRLAK